MNWILLLAGLVAGLLSGAVGFGGGMVLLPVVTSLYGIEVAVPVCTIAQLGSNLSKVVMGWRDIEWKQVGMCEDYNPTDNGLAERVNGTIKTEWLYPLPLLRDLQEAQERIAHFVDLYNNVRPHLSLKNRTPMSVYLDDPSIVPAARWHYEQAEKCAERAFF